MKRPLVFCQALIESHRILRVMGKDAEQKECRVELASFEDLARLACSNRAHPRRIYSFVITTDASNAGCNDTNNNSNGGDGDGEPSPGIRVAAVMMNLSNTIVGMYAPLPAAAQGKDRGRYVSYAINDGKESCKLSDAVSNGSSSAPLIHLESGMTALDVAETASEIPDVFSPVRLDDLGSLARLTYDPDFPEEPELTLYAVPLQGLPSRTLTDGSGSEGTAGSTQHAWALGYLIMYDMDESHCIFYHVICEKGPEMPFLRYRHDEDRDPEFVEKVEHGYMYMPIVKLKRPHPIFGFGK